MEQKLDMFSQLHKGLSPLRFAVLSFVLSLALMSPQAQAEKTCPQENYGPDYQPTPQQKANELPISQCVFDPKTGKMQPKGPAPVAPTPRDVVRLVNATNKTHCTGDDCGSQDHSVQIGLHEKTKAEILKERENAAKSAGESTPPGSK